MYIEQLSLQTFRALVDNRATETNKIEFKKFSFSNGKVTTEQKEKIEKEIAAFANADGGTIFIGIDESKEKAASQIVGVGCGIEKLDEIQLAIQSRLLAKVHPRIYGISIQGFPLSDDDMVMTISVPKSISRPHAVNDGNKDNFYIRHSNGITNMSLDDLRRDILAGATYQAAIRKYRQDRIGMIMCNEYIRHLQDGAKIVLHIIPLWSLDFGSYIDLSLLENFRGRNQFRPMSASSYNVAFCADGKVAFHCPYKTDYVQSSVLLTRTGILEAVDAHMMNSSTDYKEAYHWPQVEGQVNKKLSEYVQLMENFDIPKPWLISISILNGKGYCTDVYGERSELLHSDYIQGVDVVLNEGQSLSDTIRPCFDALANAFGFEKSFLNE